MFTCKQCGRKFKTSQALAGHVSGAHSRNHVEQPPGNGNSQPVESEVEEPGVGEEIRYYIGQGYDFEQLTKVLGFNPRSVRREMAKVVPPASEQGENQDSSLPVTVKQTEVISPEAVLRRYMDGSYEDELELRGMMKLRASMLMVMELANIQKTMAEAEARRLEPLLKVLKESREELDAAAARARASSFEMAQEAAEGAVGRVLGYIDQKLPKGPPPKDVSEMITKRLDKMWDLMDHMMEQRMFPGYQANKPPEGWEYREVPASPASQPPPQAPPPTQSGSPPGWETKQVKEEADV